MQVQPYLFFEGRCDAAIEFYRNALGAELEMLMRYKESPDQEACPQGARGMPDPEKVMHASLRIGQTQVMVSDGLCNGRPTFEGFSLSLDMPDAAAADRAFAALANGGEVQMPLGETFFSPRFGMVKDRFGVSWMIIVAPDEQQEGK